MRINRYIASSGFCSRRAADKFVELRRVTINGKIASLGDLVGPNDLVKVDSITLNIEDEKVYYMLYKPRGYLTAASDFLNRRIVTELIDEEKRIFPIGRLDLDSEGLLLLTNDGDLFNRVIHPKHEVFKTYLVEVSSPVTDEELIRLREGVVLEDGLTLPAKVKLIKKDTLVEIAIREGRKRQIRRMFKALGNRVLNLKRVAIGGLKLDLKSAGEYRRLTPQEVEYLMSL